MTELTPDRGRPTRARLAAVSASLALVLGMVSPPQSVEAAFTNPEFARGSLTAAVVNPPTGPSGAVLLGCETDATLGMLRRMTVTWAPPATGLAPTSYRVDFVNNAGTVLQPTPMSSGTTSRTYSGGLVTGLLAPGTYTVRVASVTTGGATGNTWTWTSQTVLSRSVTLTTLGGWSCS